MDSSVRSSRRFAFGPYEVRIDTGELLKHGHRVRLQRQPFQVLSALLLRPGELVTRDELRDQVWQEGTFVEFEHGLNAAINRLRDALSDNADKPRYIETLPRRGYRFIAAVGSAAAPARALTPVKPIRPEIPEAIAPVTLAVLPFENLGAGAEREYLADGLTEEVIAALGQIDPEHLSLIGRTSMMTYKGTKKPLAEIAGELGAAFLVESSLRAEGTRLRVTSRLIRASDQIQVWSESYDSEPRSLLEFERELSAVVARQIHLRLSPRRLDTLQRRQTRDAEAYDLYLRGLYFWNRLSRDTTPRAVGYFVRATEIDPRYALAWSGLARAYATSPINGDAPPLQVGQSAREAAARAVEADPDLAEVQASLGLVKFWIDWDWPAAEAALRKAIALDASYGIAHRLLGIVLSHLGRHHEALAAARRAREIDPLDVGHQALSAQVAFAAGDYSAAEQFARQAIVLDPEFWIGHVQLGQACEPMGKSAAALDALQRAAEFGGANSKAIAYRGHLLAKLGRTDEARDVAKLLEDTARQRYIPAHAVALVYAGLGERESALDWLERAYEARDVHLAFLTVDPRWNEFRGDARFVALLRQCNFEAHRSPLVSVGGDSKMTESGAASS